MSASVALQSVPAQYHPAYSRPAPSVGGAFPRKEPKEEFAALDKVGTVVMLRRGETLFYEGDSAESYFKVVSGAVRSCRLLADGRRHIGAFFLTGDFLGLNDEDTYHVTAEAVSDTTLIRYSRRSVDALMGEEPGLSRSLLRIVCHGLSAAQEQMLLLGRKTAQEKIASFLLMMADRSGRSDQLTLPMTRTDIGDYLGLTIETVSRAFSQLKSEGIIQLKSANEVLIRDREALEEMADRG
jgi:CRP/FNR family transcriptional regulator, anaerobic regulatory protein